MKKLLIDTSGYSHLLRGDEKVFLALSKADIVYMSVFVIGELYAGFKGGSRELTNKDLLIQFIEKPTVHVLKATVETAEIFGQLKHDLRIMGTPIPINDIWIASHTIETGSVIITYDVHYLMIKGLRIWDHIHG